jgi:hypothetical protein
VLLTAQANVGAALIQLTPPRPILIEQVGAVCEGSAPKMVRVSAMADASLATGFTTSPDDAGNKVSGAWFGAQMATTAAPQGWSGSGVPPTPTRMIAAGGSSSVNVSFFREMSSASTSEYCYVYLAGRWIQ